MAVNVLRTLQLVDELLDKDKYRVSDVVDGGMFTIVEKIPGTPEERRNGKKKWERKPVLSTQQIDLICRTSLDEMESAKKIIDQIIHGRNPVPQVVAAAADEIPPHLEAKIHAKLQKMLAEEIAKIRANEGRLEEIAKGATQEIVLEAATEIAAVPKGLQKTGRKTSRTGEIRDKKEQLKNDRLALLNARAMALNWRPLPTKWLGWQQAKLKRDWIKAGGTWEGSAVDLTNALRAESTKISEQHREAALTGGEQ